MLVLGEPGTGKSSIIKRYVHNFFETRHKTTVGVDFHIKNLVVGNRPVRLQLWDIATAGDFGISRVYYNNTVGAFVVYDVSRPMTFDTVAKWREEIDTKVGLSNGKPLPLILLANKSDLDEAKIDGAKLDEFCEQNGFAGWLETSAKMNINLEKATHTLGIFQI